MPFVPIDHTAAFAIDAAAKASDMQQVDQNIDDHETRIVAQEASFKPYAAGGVLMASSDTERSTSSGSYVKTKAFAVARAGVLRVKFGLRSSGGNAVYAKLYRNGVAVGTERSTTSTSTVTFSEDISGWTAGDTCELWIKIGPGPTVYASNFRLYADPPEAIVSTYDA